MTADFAKRALECIASGDENLALDLVKEWIATAAGGDASTPAPDPDSQAANATADDPPPSGDDAGSEGDGADGVAPPPKKKKVNVNALTAQQLAICKEHGISPADFLTVKRALGERGVHFRR